MFDVTLKEAVNTLVEFSLKRGESILNKDDPRDAPRKALYVRVDIRLSAYLEDGDDFQVRRMVHFLFTRPSNYTKVFFCHNREFRIPSPDQFEMMSNHDSCWREDGYRGLGDLRREAVEHLSKESGLPERKLSEFVTFDEVKYVTIQTERYDRRFEVTNIARFGG